MGQGSGMAGAHGDSERPTLQTEHLEPWSIARSPEFLVLSVVESHC